MASIDELDMVIQRKGEKVIASIPQLGLVATASEPQAALSALETKKNLLLEDMKAAGVADDFEIRSWSRGAPVGGQPLRWGGILEFLVKFAIVLVVLGGIGVASASVVAARIKEQSRVGGAEFWSKLEANLARAQGLESVVLFALDQFCLIGYPPPPFVDQRWSRRAA